MNVPQISIAAQPEYLPEESDPAQNRYAFAYHISIRNTGQIAAQLIARHWLITDANNAVQEVRGLGVIGYQPLLQPGESFEYSSGCILETPVGTMQGSYQMMTVDGQAFDAPIAEFVLTIPRVLH